MSQGEAERIATAFSKIETFVFDLDNTLYPATSDLWPKIDDRITLFMIRLFGLDSLSLRALQKHYYKRYGTTLRGLMTEHGVDAEAYLRYVHDVDRSSLKPDHTLAAAIAALPGRKLILTNGSREHAVETARALGVDHLFEDIFDIVAADFVAKPEAEAYERFFSKHAIDPRRAALFEDIARNLEVPHRRGTTTVLVKPLSDVSTAREHWEIADGLEPHVDFVTSDLAAFLESVTAS
ncbi:pyrimidine 5'-nucleotidase [Methylocystis bryophila]|uniref:Pyrimidine 5'-nucleotidase n=1 Tax=Methylocystis bryophila TaxID=655015 RepID=A0A1W6N1M2_9HYPH|nr:pyrimidine 5'-nucleotidase [Methylocystis bryophila]ARN83651.1 pyrimidine 5'-nucleotidase [Methylocystis bryophila]